MYSKWIVFLLCFYLEPAHAAMNLRREQMQRKRLSTKSFANFLFIEFSCVGLQNRRRKTEENWRRCGQKQFKAWWHSRKIDCDRGKVKKMDLTPIIVLYYTNLKFNSVCAKKLSVFFPLAIFVTKQKNL